MLKWVGVKCLLTTALIFPSGVEDHGGHRLQDHIDGHPIPEITAVSLRKANE